MESLSPPEEFVHHSLDFLRNASSFAKPIFRKWEGLRLPYNACLLLTLLLLHEFNFQRFIANPVQFLIWLAGAVGANMCFLAAPVAETYLAWLGWRSVIITVALFTVGVLVSIPCVYFFTMSFGF